MTGDNIVMLSEYLQLPRFTSLGKRVVGLSIARLREETKFLSGVGVQRSTFMISAFGAYIPYADCNYFWF